MAMIGNVVTTLQARNSLGKLLRRAEKEGRSVVISKRGVPRAVPVSVQKHVHGAVPQRGVGRKLKVHARRSVEHSAPEGLNDAKVEKGGRRGLGEQACSHVAVRPLLDERAAGGVARLALV